jgi:hypothetical protein
MKQVSVRYLLIPFDASDIETAYYIPDDDLPRDQFGLDGVTCDSEFEIRKTRR